MRLTISWLCFIQPLLSISIQFSPLYHVELLVAYKEIFKATPLNPATLIFWSKCCTQNLSILSNRTFSKAVFNLFCLLEINVNMYWFLDIYSLYIATPKITPNYFWFHFQQQPMLLEICYFYHPSNNPISSWTICSPFCAPTCMPFWWPF